jgi:RNA polymerase sigma factor (sigma-70 family)
MIPWTAQFIDEHFTYLQTVGRAFSKAMEKHAERREEVAEELTSEAVLLLIPKLDAMDEPTRTLMVSSAPFRNTVFRNAFRDAKDKVLGCNQERFEKSQQSIGDLNPAGSDLETELLNSENSNLLARALRNLNPDERGVVFWTFGLEGEPQSQSEIGERLGLHQSQISRLLGTALEKLRGAGLSKPLASAPSYKNRARKPPAE